MHTIRGCATLGVPRPRQHTWAIEGRIELCEAATDRSLPLLHRFVELSERPHDTKAQAKTKIRHPKYPLYPRGFEVQESHVHAPYHSGHTPTTPPTTCRQTR